MIDKCSRNLRRGGSAGEPDRLTFGDTCSGLAGDPELLFLVPTAFIPERQLIQDPLRDRSTMRPRQQSLALEKAKVTAHSGG